MFKREMFCKKCLNDYNGKKAMCNECLVKYGKPSKWNKRKAGK